MHKLGLKKAEESGRDQTAKHSVDRGESKRIPQKKKNKKIYFFFIDYTKALDCVDHSRVWKIL